VSSKLPHCTIAAQQIAVSGSPPARAVTGVQNFMSGHFVLQKFYISSDRIHVIYGDVAMRHSSGWRGPI
jgi:hypothetical protein